MFSMAKARKRFGNEPFRKQDIMPYPRRHRAEQQNTLVIQRDGRINQNLNTRKLHFYEWVYLINSSATLPEGNLSGCVEVATCSI